MTRVRLVNWRLIRLKDSLFFNGRVEGTTRGRISSQVVSMDFEAMEGTTRSGNTYELVGSSSFEDLAADAILEKWMRDYGLGFDDIEIVVITERLYAASGVMNAGSRDQALDEGAEQGFPAFAGVVNEFEEADIKGQLLLRSTRPAKTALFGGSIPVSIRP